MIFWDSQFFRWLGKNRGEISVLIAALTILDFFFGNAAPLDLLKPAGDIRFILYWGLMALGSCMRIWAAGNLQANQGITATGPYRMVRHPLYLGTLLGYSAFFIALGDIIVGPAIFCLMFLLIYFPRILQEEDNLARQFPGALTQYWTLPRILPNPLLIQRAIQTNAFSWRRAFRNRGLGSIWSILIASALFEAAVKVRVLLYPY